MKEKITVYTIDDVHDGGAGVVNRNGFPGVDLEGGSQQVVRLICGVRRVGLVDLQVAVGFVRSCDTGAVSSRFGVL